MGAALRTSFGALHRKKQHLPDVCSGAAGGTVAGRKSPFAFRTSAPGVGDRMDRGTQSAGQRTDRAAVRNAAGPLGKGNAPGRDRQHRSRQSFFGDAFSSGVGTAFHGGTSQAAQCTPTVGSRTAVGGNSKRARGTPGGRRSHRQLGWQPLGRATRRSLRRSSRCAGGNRTKTGWLALATLPRPLSPAAPLPSTPATVRKSFRPTASRTCGTNTKTQKQNQTQTQIPCACSSPLEETVEPDISTWRKTGHFYFALTRTCHQREERVWRASHLAIAHGSRSHVFARLPQVRIVRGMQDRESSTSTLGTGSGLTTGLARSSRSRYGLRTLGAGGAKRGSAAGWFSAETRLEPARFADSRP